MARGSVELSVSHVFPKHAMRNCNQKEISSCSSDVRGWLAIFKCFRMLPVIPTELDFYIVVHGVIKDLGKKKKAFTSFILYECVCGNV